TVSGEILEKESGEFLRTPKRMLSWYCSYLINPGFVHLYHLANIPWSPTSNLLNHIAIKSSLSHRLVPNNLLLAYFQVKVWHRGVLS
ncbi:MAG: hypothetical protein ABI166_05575, partial [Mucilaginibacter sp.]